MSEEEFKVMIQKFSDEMHIDADTYLKILKATIDSTHNDLKDLKEKAASQDFEVIEQISHRLKGTFSNLRVENLSKIMTEMNDLSKKSENIERISELVINFESEFLKFDEQLAKV